VNIGLACLGSNQPCQTDDMSVSNIGMNIPGLISSVSVYRDEHALVYIIVSNVGVILPRFIPTVSNTDDMSVSNVGMNMP
jgi:hypothetical protein